MPIPVKATCVHVVLQSSLGTAATITVGTTPALRVVGDVQITRRGEGQIARTDLSSSLGGPVGPRLGSLGWTFAFRTELYGPASADDLSTTPLGPLFYASAPVVETTGSPDTGTWTPALGPTPTASGSVPGAGLIGVVTMAVDEIGGNRYALYDGVAKCVGWEADAGGIIYLDWEVQGKWVAPAASTVTAGSEAYNPGDAFELTPWTFCGVTLTSGLAGTPTGLASFSLDPGQELVERSSAGADGASCMAISFLDRNPDGPSLGFTIDADDETALGAWTEYLAGSQETRGITIPAPSGASIASAIIRLNDAWIDTPERGGDTYRTFDLMARGTTDGGAAPFILTFNGAT